MEINLKFKLTEFITIQFSMVTLMILLGLFSYIFTHLTGHGSLLGFLRLLDVDSEQSIPTYFSVVNLILASVLLFIIYKYEKTNNHNGFYYWLILSILFLFLSVDESAGIHENFTPVHNYLVKMGILSQASQTRQWIWIAYYAFFGLVFIIAIFPFYKSLSKGTLRLFIISGVIFVIGAMGIEHLGYIMLQSGFVDSEKNIVYLICLTFEEGFEMIGIAIFNCAVYREILKRNIFLKIVNE